MPSLYKRDPFWWISLTPNESRLLSKPRGFSTKKKIRREAEITLKEIKKKIAVLNLESRYKNKAPRGRMFFSDVLNMYTLDKKNFGGELDVKTRTLYQQAVNLLISACGDKLVNNYTKEDFNIFIAKMNNHSQNTKWLYSGKIRTLFTFMREEGYISHNHFKTVKSETNAINIISQEKMQKFLEYAKTTKFYNVVMLMYIGAFRASEAMSITPNNIKKDHIEIIGKGNKLASIPITRGMREFLNTKPKLDKRTSVHNYTYVNLFFNRASKKLNFKIRSHDLRKFQLSKLANAGVNVYFVMNYARHSDIKTTLQYYAGVDMEKMKIEIDSKLLQ